VIYTSPEHCRALHSGIPRFCVVTVYIATPNTPAFYLVCTLRYRPPIRYC